MGQLTRATQSSGATTLAKSGYSYDDAGNRISTQIGSALTRTLSDDTNSPISTQGGGPMRFAGQLSKPASVTVAGVAATVDSRNRFEAKVNLSPGPQTIPVVATDPSDNSTVTRNYQVDVTGGAPRNYGRDNNGNITSSSSPDGSGAPNATHEWDASDRLTAINIGTHRTEIQYDGLGRRVHLTEKETGNISGEKRFVWFGNELCEERDGTGGIVTKRFFGAGEQRIGGSDAGIYFYTRDHLGSIRELTDSGGSLRGRYDYDSWGRRTKLEGNLDCDFGFTGFYFHDPSGLSFSRSRAYDALLAKWLSRDPIGENGGPNLYGYVGNDPVNFIDPSGLLGVVPSAAAIQAGASAAAGASWITVFGAVFFPLAAVAAWTPAGQDFIVNNIVDPWLDIIMPLPSAAPPGGPPGCGPKSPPSAPDPGEERYQRQKAVNEAWKLEQDLVGRTGQGTRPWTNAEKAELLETGRVSGYQGHHINSVSSNPQLAGNPNNIQFVRPGEHLGLHGGNWSNPTWGPLVPR